MNRRAAVGGFRAQGGAVLIVALLFMTVLTLVGVSAMRGTSMQYRMSTNDAFKQRSFAASETGRRVLAGVLDEHVFERGWTRPGGASLVPSGLTVHDGDGDGLADALYLDNAAGESPLDPSTLQVDASFSQGAVNADLMVYRAGAVASPGGASVMGAGYEGLGKSMSAGGAQVLLRLRSRGQGQGEARSETGADFRAVVQ